MTGGFVALVFELCVALSNHRETILRVGYVAAGKCQVKAVLNSRERTIINGHEIDFDPLDGGVVIHVDDRDFVIVSTEGA